MDDKVTNLIDALFTWSGRIGPVRFVVTFFLILLLSTLLILWEATASLQSFISPIIGWCLLMQFVKRGHDFGAPGWVSMIAALASVCVVPISFWAVMPRDNNYNKYGVRGA